MQVWRKACQQEKKYDGNIGINEKPLGEESELACHYRKLRVSKVFMQSRKEDKRSKLKDKNGFMSGTPTWVHFYLLVFIFSLFYRSSWLALFSSSFSSSVR